MYFRSVQAIPSHSSVCDGCCAEVRLPADCDALGAATAAAAADVAVIQAVSWHAGGGPACSHLLWLVPAVVV